MKAYVINLKRRPDRLEHIIKECERVGLEMVLIEASDGKIDFPEHTGIMQGAMGCYTSHLKALKKIQESGEHGLILEDDCCFIEKFWEGFSLRVCELPSEWDMFFLGGSLLWENAVLDYSDYLKIANNVLCTQSYMINKNSVVKLIEHLEKRAFKVDVLYTEFQKENNCFISYPELTWQKEGYSDLVNMETNNTHLRYGRS